MFSSHSRQAFSVVVTLAASTMIMSAIMTFPQSHGHQHAAVASAAPIPVPDNDSNLGGGVNADNDWQFQAADVCIQELAVVPVLGNSVSEHVNTCANGNVIDHSG